MSQSERSERLARERTVRTTWNAGFYGWFLVVLALASLCCGVKGAGATATPKKAPTRSLLTQMKELSSTLNRLGSPLSKRTRQALERAFRETDEERQAEAIAAALAPYCLLAVEINPESRVQITQGHAPPKLVQGRWVPFLVQVHNQAGVTAPLRASSPNALPLSRLSKRSGRQQWMSLSLVQSSPFTPKLTGEEWEFRIFRLYSRDAGKREAKIAFDVGQGTQDIGFRNEVNLLFQCAPSSTRTLRSH